MFAFQLLSGVALITTVFAHMQLDYPAPFNSSNNMHRTTSADPYLQYPYDCCGENDRWQYPCRGYASLLGTPDGAPTATWEAGQTANWNISGIGNHYGGSCQVGFSTDKGDTFRVATSYEGNCPHRDDGNGPDGQNFEFTVPSDLSTGVQIFAWVWYNREQELNMNCAAVNITSPSAGAAPPFPSSTFAPSPSQYSSPAATYSVSVAMASSTYRTANGCTCTCQSPTDVSSCTCIDCPSGSKYARGTSPSVAWNDRPIMFVADDGNDCLTLHGTAELKYPDPGPDVVPGDGVYPLELPTGTGCSADLMLAKQGYNGTSGNDGH